jgi:asparagine synthase (glutamine-hydrolysing)
MCGIAGIVGLQSKDIASSKIRQMAQSLAHRGPDAEGYFVQDGIALGHRRLSIIDLSEAANQPQFDPAGRYAIILNGEIYNYKDVRRQLKDYSFRTESDTEAILAAYIAHGSDCVSMLNGMFAFAIWDNVRKELFIARDRLGVKPLYYSITTDGVLVFASELRAILDSGLVERALDHKSLSEYLVYQSVYAPKTIVKDIRQLPAGSFGIFNGTDFSIREYWRIEKPDVPHELGDAVTVKNKVRDLLLASVERRMISDVRLGAFLSGGIDSSAIVGLMSELSTQPVDTFSVTFDEAKFDESRYSNLIAARFNTRHTSVRLTPKDFLDELPNALAATDSPSGDGLNTYIVAKATKSSGITVALSGLGGDELFAGYPYFFKYLKLRTGLLPKLPPLLRKPFGMALAASPRSKYQRMGKLLSSEKLTLSETYPTFRQVMSETEAHNLYHNGSGTLAIKDLLFEKKAAIDAFPLLSQISIAELIGYTQNVLLKDTDQFGMASALEIREPFFDYHLVEYVLQIPDEMKLGGYPKSLLVDSLAPMLPDEIVRRKKMGFVLPWDAWMRNELRDLCEARIRRLSEVDLFDGRRLADKWSAFLAGSKSVVWSEFWHLVVLSDWLERNKFI